MKLCITSFRVINHSPPHPLAIHKVKTKTTTKSEYLFFSSKNLTLNFFIFFVFSYIFITLLDLCRISVTFFDKDGEEQEIKVPIGMSMLEAAHENDIELEG